MKRRCTVLGFALLVLSFFANCVSTSDLSSVDNNANDASSEASSPYSEASVDTGPINAGGPGADPMRVECGGSSLCTVPTQQCCATPIDGGAGVPPALDAKCQSVSEACNGVVARCDETADCPTGELCCLSGLAMKAPKLSCATSCVVGGATVPLQACRTDIECAGGKKCKLHRCYNNLVRGYVCEGNPECVLAPL